MRAISLLFRHPIIFSKPLRLASSGWIQHIPFAFFLVELFRPKLMVELGSFSGVSYCAFCQAVKILNLETRCFAVDTWQGDAHAGIYEEEVLSDLRDHHDPLYSGFSTLLQMPFEEALDRFADKSIDLLHIDGYHTYEAVKNDFYSWLPKMSKRGIVLFHDTNVRAKDFGVCMLWEELRMKYSCFDFSHGSGLGVLFVGEYVPEWFNTISSAPQWELGLFRTFFSVMGKRIDAIKMLRAQIELG